ncbi:hypothetical protein CONPUDRAFT_48001 [Coniophora puteana RWD-64-598 SS2]|uniref:CENP-C homolog n=1 Tax=Coniophora puteana (strain RWD-64-598) TaxID=741705 RepID=A0A5M3N186_CONPW|nr:uncharacterized protein CONPUDRAFT_48001 [Coniophora puteana RWD-64-598 SS2]EIW84784.1 hypothetical protein CONPUDRAFT_48001 [Coniophora puteana RWD-64-598 SS2]
MPRVESVGGRKSSIGARRGPPKKHVPYRHDDLMHGKRTGMAVEVVEHDSDDFESFTEVLKQAEGRYRQITKPAKRRQSTARTPVREDYGEDGEMSMDLASEWRSFLASRKSYVPNSVTRVGSSKVTHTSDVDFDQVPSPHARPSNFSQRMSLANGPNGSTMEYGRAGPSSLSRPYSLGRSPPANGDMDDDDDDNEPAGFDDYAPPDDMADVDMHRSSFMQIDEGDTMEEAEVDRQTRSPSFDKGKRKSYVPDDDMPMDNGVEDDIAAGMAELDAGQDEEDERTPPPPKKAKATEKKPRKKREMKTFERSPTPPGARRSRRTRYAPLEYWRQERVVLGRADHGVTLVPEVKEIVRVPKEPVIPLGKNGQKQRRAASRAKSRPPASAVYNLEEGWDDETPISHIVLDYLTQEEVKRRIAFTNKMLDPRPAGNNDWFFEKVFGDADFMAVGMVVIPPGGRKPNKATKDNTYAFCVLQGAIKVVIHESSMILATGGMFLVPRGNHYLIENICEREVRLFFTQARRVPLEDFDEGEGEGAVDSRRQSHDSRGSTVPKKEKEKR